MRISDWSSDVCSSDLIDELHRGKFLRLVRDRHWEYVTRVNSSGAGFIAALTDAGEVVLVEQYRLPLHARTIELPAGMIGDEDAFRDESIEASTMRELEEETGFRGTQAEILMRSEERRVGKEWVSTC